MATTYCAASSPFLRQKLPPPPAGASGSGRREAQLSAQEQALERTKILFRQRQVPFPDFKGAAGPAGGSKGTSSGSSGASTPQGGSSSQGRASGRLLAQSLEAAGHGRGAGSGSGLNGSSSGADGPAAASSHAGPRAKELKNAHLSAVRSLGWSCDGAWLATCGDETVRIWAPERSTDVRGSRELRGHTKQMHQLAWHPYNPNALASISSDKTMRVWDTRESNSSGSSSGANNAQIVQLANGGLNLTYHPSGNYIAMGDKDDRVWLIDTRTCKIAAMLRERAPGEEFNELAFTPDGRQLIISSNQGDMHILDTSCLLSPSFAPPAAEQAKADAGSAAPTAQTLSLPTSHSLNGHSGAVFCLRTDRTNRYAVTGGADSVVALWDVNEWTSSQLYGGRTGGCRSVDFSGDSELIAVAGEEPEIDIIATCTMTSIHKIPFPCEYGVLAWHPSRYVLAFAGEKSGSAHVWGL